METDSGLPGGGPSRLPPAAMNTALVLLSHEPADRVHRMVVHWKETTTPAQMIVAFGGAPTEFERLECPAVFVEDRRLRTRDHQRERQSYTGMLRDVLAVLPAEGWDFLYLAEFDMLPAVPDLWVRLQERMDAENADLLGHKVWKLDDTLHPHYSSHLATPGWLEWIGSISCRSSRGVVLSCMGCGQYWRKAAIQAVVAAGEPAPAYLELHLPTVAHHLGFRVRGIPDQDRFVSNFEIPGTTPALLRDLGAWVIHPVKRLWDPESRAMGVLPVRAEDSSRGKHEPVRPPAGTGKAGRADFPHGWKSRLQPLVERIGRVALGPQPVHLMRGGYRLALGLPPDAKAAACVLGLYHPYRLSGWAFRSMGIAQVATGAYRRLLPTYASPSASAEVDWLAAAAAEGRVGFLGANPAHGLRCTLGGLTAGRDSEPFVAKLGFDDGSAVIAAEAAILGRLASRHAGVPRVLSTQVGKDWFLMRLPNLGYVAPSGMETPEVLRLISDWLAPDWRLGRDLPWLVELLGKARAAGADEHWCQRMLERSFRLCLQHGDFAVWNLRMTPVGLYAIDWEWAVEDGVAGMDLAHGLRQEAVMVRGLGAAAAVRWVLGRAAERPQAYHLDLSGWSDSQEDWLRLGLVRSHFAAKSDSREMLGELGIRLSK